MGDTRKTANATEKSSDIEAISVAEELRDDSSSPSPSSETDEAPIALENTPFFHFDITSAVKAAEYALRRTDSSSIRKGSVDSGKRPLSSTVLISDR